MSRRKRRRSGNGTVCNVFHCRRTAKQLSVGAQKLSRNQWQSRLVLFISNEHHFNHNSLNVSAFICVFLFSLFLLAFLPCIHNAIDAIKVVSSSILCIWLKHFSFFLSSFRWKSMNFLFLSFLHHLFVCSFFSLMQYRLHIFFLSCCYSNNQSGCVSHSKRHFHFRW